MSIMVALLLVVRVFDRTGESAADRGVALRTAEAILKDAAIATVWVDCSRGSPAAGRPECTAPLSPGERTVRITQAPAGVPERGHWALGYSLVEPDTGSGTLATVFSDRISWLARTTGTRPTILLGRAVAHEIGHLLIGTNEHSAQGLMRPDWTAAELSRNRPEDWLFAAQDRTRLRNAYIGDSDAPRIAEGGEDLDAGES